MKYIETYNLIKNASLEPVVPPMYHQALRQVTPVKQPTGPTKNYLRISKSELTVPKLKNLGYQEKPLSFWERTKNWIGNQIFFDKQSPDNEQRTFTSNLPIVQQNLRIYGQPSEPQHPANQAVRWRNAYTQRRRAQLLGKDYGPKKRYPLPYWTIGGKPWLDILPIHSKQRSYRVTRNYDRSHAGWGLVSGKLPPRADPSLFLQQLIHDSSQGYPTAGHIDYVPRILPSMKSGNNGSWWHHIVDSLYRDQIDRIKRRQKQIQQYQEELNQQFDYAVPADMQFRTHYRINPQTHKWQEQRIPIDPWQELGSQAKDQLENSGPQAMDQLHSPAWRFPSEDDPLYSAAIKDYRKDYWNSRKKAIADRVSRYKAQLLPLPAPRYTFGPEPFAGAYTNSMVQGAGVLGHLFGFAASNGKKFKSFEKQLLPWLIQQGYLTRDRRGNLLAGKKGFPGFSVRPQEERQYKYSDQGGHNFFDFLYLLNSVQELKRKVYSGKASKQEQEELREALRRLQLLSQVAE